MHDYELNTPPAGPAARVSPFVSLPRWARMTGGSASIQRLETAICRVAKFECTTLITGETGCGKEEVARAIHAAGPRHDKPFISVNCAGIPAAIAESQLFGHEKGAFTGASGPARGAIRSADGGVIFLDEIGDMPADLQPKLLGFLERREVTPVGSPQSEPVDVMVIAATNRHLEAAVAEGAFREDLLYRLNTVHLVVPPLRDRSDDIPRFVAHFSAHYATRYRQPPWVPGPATLARLVEHDWPGNVRQLENRVKKALVLCDRSLLGPEDLDLHPEALQTIVPLEKAKEDFQRRYILEVLERNNGNRTKTARDLGVDPRTIFRYLEREGGPAPGGPGED